MSGKLIVIEGTDGAGKGTQLQLLKEYCDSHHVSSISFDFPQYDKTFFGNMCGEFLRGEFGNVENTSPYLVSLPYAADRWKAKDAIVTALNEGKLVLVNRYATSNAAYQAAKLPEAQRRAFIDWEFTLEYKEFGIPKEDSVIYLHVPVTVSQKLIEQKENRSYLNGKKKDIHEENIELQKTTEEVYTTFCNTYPHWICIECAQDDTILTKEIIHKKIVGELQKKGILS